MQKLLQYFFTTLFILPFLHVQASDYPPDPYHGMNYQTIFDQSAILQKTSLKNLSPQAINRLLIQDLKKKKQKVAQNRLGKYFFSTIIDTAILGIPFLFLSKKAKESFLYVLINSVTGYIKDITRNVWELTHTSNDRFYKYELMYTCKKRFFSHPLQQRIENRLNLERNFNYLDFRANFLDIALNLPVHSKKPNPHALDILRNSITGYTPEIFPQIKHAITEHFRRFTTRKGPNSSPKPLLYFQGPPGTGKTFIAEAIAKALELPVIRISLATDNPEDILGNSYDKPGRLLEALTNPEIKSARNTVVIFDEADRVFNNERSAHILNVILPLLDPSTTHFYSPFLSADIDISHFLIIAIGNSPIKDPALASRFDIVNFAGMTLAYKEQLILNHILPQLAHSENPDYCINLKTLDPQQWAEIKTIIMQDPDENLRSLQRKLATYLNQLR